MSGEPRSLVIPAAGLGKRMKRVNPALPKEMLPIGSKPAIQFAVEEAIDAGMDQIIIIISEAKEQIRDYCSGLGVPVTFLYQQEPKGEADAIALAEEAVGNHALAIIYPDNLFLPAPGALRRLVAIFQQHRIDVLALATVTQEQEATIGNAGRVDLTEVGVDLYQIQRFLPKGPGYFKRRFKEELRACGMMVCGPHIFDAIRRAREVITAGEFTDEPVRVLLLNERGLLGVRLPGTVFDIGNPEGYKRCLEEIAG